MPKLKEIRRFRHLRQKDLANKAAVDITTVGRMERGTQKPLFPTLQKIADALEVDVADIEFQQWTEDYINELQLPSELKGSSEDQAEIQKPRVAEENEIEAEEIIIEDKYADRLRPTPLQSKEEQQPEPEVEVHIIKGELADRLRSPKPYSPKKEAESKSEPEPKVEMVRTTPTRTAEAESNALVEPEKASLAAPTIAAISLLDTKKWWVWLLVLLGICVAVYLLLRWDAGRSEAISLPRGPVKTKSGHPVTDFLDNYGN